MHKDAIVRVAGQGLCLALLLATTHAGAAQQGSLGATSSGSVRISVSIAPRAVVSDPKDVDFGARESPRARTSQRLCLSSNMPASSFDVFASGDGPGGALVLSDGHRNLPYKVQFASPEGSASWRHSATSDSSGRACEPGQRSIDYAIAVDPAHLDALRSDAGFTGSLTLMVAPG